MKSSQGSSKANEGRKEGRKVAKGGENEVKDGRKQGGKERSK